MEHSCGMRMATSQAPPHRLPRQHLSLLLPRRRSRLLLRSPLKRQSPPPSRLLCRHKFCRRKHLPHPRPQNPRKRQSLRLHRRPRLNRRRLPLHRTRNQVTVTTTTAWTRNFQTMCLTVLRFRMVTAHWLSVMRALEAGSVSKPLRLIARTVTMISPLCHKVLAQEPTVASLALSVPTAARMGI